MTLTLKELEEAREALRRGTTATLAYVMDVDEEDIRRVAGDIDPDLFRVRQVSVEGGTRPR